jgi:hypothetical protein
MAGIFPGMDPFLEFQSPWPDLHNGLIAETRDELGARPLQRIVGALGRLWKFT